MSLVERIETGYELAAWLGNRKEADEFSPDGLDAIAEYFNALGEDQEIDISIFWEFEEKSREEIEADYSATLDLPEDADDDDFLEEVERYTFIQKLENGNFLFIRW